MVVLLLVGSGASARGQVVDAEDAFVAHIAQERSSRGLGALAFAEDLQVVARRHAQRMADRGEPYHNPDLGTEVQDWEIVAENVGVGPDVDTIHRAFMDSQEHRDIILHPDLTQLGVGVVGTNDGRLWVVEVFRKPQEAQQAPPQSQPTAQAAPPPSSTHAPTRSSTTAPVASTTSASTSVPTEQPSTVAAQAGTSEVALAEAAATRAHGSTASGRGVIDASPPIIVAPNVAGVAAELPAEAWVAAFLLAAVVGFQGQALRRLGLVA